MNDAGRIGFVLKGDYSGSTTYEILDVVRYGNASYVAKATVTGILPTDTSKWQCLVESGDGVGTGYGTCGTAADVAAKEVTLQSAGNWALKVGAEVLVKSTNTNTAQNPTLNVNGTGAKSIWYNNALLTTSNADAAGVANRYTRYTYDGTYWVWSGQSLDNNTTYSKMSQSEADAGTATSARTITAAVLRNAILGLREDRTPIGTVIGSLGTHAPSTDYLLCDGTVYNISAYPKLAAWIKTEYGSYNYFGGDGSTTFSVPDFTVDYPTNGVLSVKAKLAD